MRKVPVVLNLFFCIVMIALLTIFVSYALAIERNVPIEYSTIQEAIDTAADGDVIIVNEGTYYENINFWGKNITLISTAPENPNVVANTIIDAGHEGSVVTFRNREGTEAVLNGFTLQNGNAIRGGGIHCWSFSSPSIMNCIIRNCSGSIGAGVYCRYSSGVHLTNCIITGNSANSTGGGICCEDFSIPKIAHCTITGNSAGLYGGGICCRFSSSPKITQCIVYENEASEGAGIYCSLNSYPIIINSTITKNLSKTEAGGVYCSYFSSPYIINSIFWDNGSQQIYLTSDSHPKLSYCNIQGGYPGLGNIADDPLFVDPEADDYHLQINSPCIDAGHPRIFDDDSTRSNIGVYGGEGGWDPNTIIISVALDGGEDFTSISDAIDYAAPGDTIFILPGRYKENLVIAGKDIAIISQKGKGSTIIEGNELGSVIALVNMGSSGIIDGFTIEKGIADEGGGIYFSPYSSLSITHCNIQANSAIHEGGGIYCNYLSYVSITDCKLSENFANTEGGGIFCYFSSLNIKNSIIQRNYAGYNGGGIQCHYVSSGAISDCIINGNLATFGGGIYFNESSLNFTNCIINKNKVFEDPLFWLGGEGGGIYCYNSAPGFINCTISRNYADYAGGAIRCSFSSPIMTNCILWNDSPSEIYNTNSTLTATYSDIKGGYEGAGNINKRPLFFASNQEDYHLRKDSPCIDSGTDIGAPAKDLDGTPRPQDGDLDTVAICDMGAYEYMAALD